MTGALLTGYLKLNEGYAIDAFIPMNKEGCMSQAAAQGVSLRMSEKSK